MLQTEALALLRSRLHETTAGYYLSTTLYSYLDAGQLAVIDYWLNQRNYIQRIDPHYEPRVLRAILNTITFNLVSGTVEYDVDAANNNYRETVGATAKYSAGVIVKATYLPKNDIDWRNTNTYQAPSVTSPAYYIAGSNLGFVPTPDTNSTGGGTHTYYFTPLTVSASQDFTLKSEAHNAIVAYAYYLALVEDKRDGSLAFQEFLNYLKQME